MSLLHRAVMAATPFVILLLLWSLLSAAGWLNTFILPSPAAVIKALAVDIASGELLLNTVSSISRVAVGFGISVLTALPLGILIGTSRRIRLFADPLLKFLRPIPPIAWIPLAILWFGIGNGPSYFLTMIASFFPILTSTISGVENVSRRHLAVANCFQASRASVMWDIIIPSSLPMMIAGVRTGFGFAWMAVVAAEMIATRAGLGYLIHTSQDMLRIDHVLVGMLTIGLIGLVADTLFVRLRDRVVHWV